MQKNIILAKKTLEKGDLVIFPTETVYGLGGDATNKEAIKKIYNLKKRPETNPIICHFRDIEQVNQNFKISKIDSLLINLFWPGALTLILQKKSSSLISSSVSNNSDLVGCRIPNHPIAIELLNNLKFPIAAPSANIATRISSTHYNHISENLRKNSFILKSGSSPLGLESTVLQTFNDKIEILRLGSITIEKIIKKIPNIRIEIKNIDSTLSPGNQFKHYSPNHPIRLNVKEVRNYECLLNFGKNNLKSKIFEYNLSSKGDLSEASKNFFNFLFLLDNLECKGIAIAPIPNYDLGRTINDRLMRASNK